MNCREVRELLPLYVDNELDQAQRRAIKTHLDGCDECRPRLALDTTLSTGLASLATPTEGEPKMPPARLRAKVLNQVENERRWRPFWQGATVLVRIAAGAILLVSVATLLVLAAAWQRSLPQQVATPRPATVVAPAKTDPQPTASGNLLARLPAAGIAEPSAQNWAFAWSQKTGALAYGTADGVYVAQPPQYKAVKIASGKNVLTPLWSPDGRYVAYVVPPQQGSPSSSTIYLAAADGSGARDLLPNEIARSVSTSKLLVAWLDERTLTYSERMGSGMAALWSVNTETGAQTRMADLVSSLSYVAERAGTTYAWSPNGKYLAVTNYGSGTPTLSVADIPGQATVRLSAQANGGPVAQTALAWEPNSRALLYAQWQAGDKPWPITDRVPDIYRWDVSTRTVLKVIPGAYRAAFAPDGKRVAVLMLGQGEVDASGGFVAGAPRDLSVGLYDLAKGGIIGAWPVAEGVTFANSGEVEAWFDRHAPSWVADGSAFAYIDGKGNVRLVAGDGKSQRQLTADIDARSFAWSPAGTLAVQVKDGLLVYSASLAGAQRPAATPGAAPTPPAAPPPTTQALAPVKLASVKMIDGNTGWALSGGRVLRTTDGGDRWADVTPGGSAQATTTDPGVQPYRVTFFLDANVAWVSPVGGAGTDGTLWRTLDAGATWAKVTLPGEAPGMGLLTFLDKSHGWFLASRGVAAGSQDASIYATQDGGASWQLMSSTQPNGTDPKSLPFGGLKRGLGFVNPQNGFAAGVTYASGVTWFYATQDGGRTWAQKPLPIPPAFKQGQVVADPPRFFGAADGILTARADLEGSAYGLVYVTHDGGNTWPEVAPLRGAIAFSFVDVNNGWAIAGQPNRTGIQLFRTSNGGKTWNVVRTDANLDGAGEIEAVGEKTGYIVGDRLNDRYIMRTTDGGTTWSELEPGVFGAPAATSVKPTSSTIPPCQPGQLSARTFWQGATGSMFGTVTLKNTGPGTCLLEGRPTVDVVDANGKVLPITANTDLQQTGAQDAPLTLQLAQEARVSFAWRNYCGNAPTLPLTVRLNGKISAPVVDDNGAPISIMPRCDVPGVGSTLSSGAFQFVEPPKPEQTPAPANPGVRMYQLDQVVGVSLTDNPLDSSKQPAISRDAKFVAGIKAHFASAKFLSGPEVAAKAVGKPLVLALILTDGSEVWFDYWPGDRAPNLRDAEKNEYWYLQGLDAALQPLVPTSP